MLILSLTKVIAELLSYQLYAEL